MQVKIQFYRNNQSISVEFQAENLKDAIKKAQEIMLSENANNTGFKLQYGIKR